MARGDAFQLRPDGAYYAWTFDPKVRKWVRRSTGKLTSRAAREVAGQWLRRGEELESGVTTDATMQQQRGILEHVADFIADKRRSPRQISPEHLGQTGRHLKRVVAELGWTSLREITLAGVLTAIEKLSGDTVEKRRRRSERDAQREMRRKRRALRRAARAASSEQAKPPPKEPETSHPTEGAAPQAAVGLSNRSKNAVLVSWCDFTRWLHREGRFTVDPLLKAAKWRLDGHRCVQRRALTVDEFNRFHAAAERGPTLARITGVDRAMLYLFAVGTGFRLSELGSLTPASIRTIEGQLMVELSGRSAKNKRSALQPLLVEQSAADRVRAWLVGRARHQRLWSVPASAAAMVRADLATAGVAARDQDGKVVDFHSLRHTLGTWLAAGGVSEARCTMLMRHASTDTTAKYYTHLDPGEVAAQGRRALRGIVLGASIGLVSGAAETGPSAAGEPAHAACQPPDSVPSDARIEDASDSMRCASAARNCTTTRDEAGRCTPGDSALRGMEGESEAFVASGVGGDSGATRDVAGRHGSGTGDLGFEPRQTESESVVLPLHQSPKMA